MEFIVYIIYNKNYDKFYIGQTCDLNKRLMEHNSGLSEYTSKYRGEWKLVYNEKFNSRGEAIKRENFLKRQKNKEFYIKLSGLK